MRSLAIVVGLCAVASPSLARVLVLDTAKTPYSPWNSFTMEIDILGLQQITLSDLSIQGTVPIDYDSVCYQFHIVEALGGSLHLQDVNTPFTGLFLTGSVALLDVTASLRLGPVLFDRSPPKPKNHPDIPRALIDQTTPGEFSLNGGTFRLTLTGGTLFETISSVAGTNIFEVDLSADSIDFSFSNLGMSVVLASTDRSGTGFDPDGAEFNMPLTGSSALELLEGVPFPVNASGNLYLGGDIQTICIPELHSLGLASLSLVGVGGMVAYRRRVR